MSQQDSNESETEAGNRTHSPSEIPPRVKKRFLVEIFMFLG